MCGFEMRRHNGDTVRRFASAGGGLMLVAFIVSGAAGAPSEISLFDGASLAGWHVSAASGHSAPSGHRAGGDWRVVEGVIVGRQDPPGNGGLLTTDRQFGDVEISLETADEWDSDSGLFLRTTPEGAAYQVMIDLYPGGTVGGIWGEALPKKLDIRRFVFGESPAGTPWRPGWNELRARITGDPPHITTWLNGEMLVDLQDTEHRLPDRGAIALQVHGGDRHNTGAVRFRNIRVVPLN
jgi:hypothetical protein